MRFIYAYRLFFAYFLIFYSQKVTGSSLNFDQQNLKILTSEDGTLTNSTENDASKYTVNDRDYVIKYDFKNGSYCTEFKLNNNTVWKYKPQHSQKGFPTSLYFYKNLGLIFADFNDLSSLFKCTQQSCKCISDHKLNGVSASNLKIKTQDPNDSTQQKVNDTTQYERIDEGFGHIYNFIKSARCTEIAYKKKVLWNYGYKSGNEYPQAVFFNTYIKMIVIKFSNFQMIYIYLDKWRFIIKPDLETLSESDIQLYTKDKKSATKENDKTQYELVKYSDNMALLYNLKQGSECNQLKFKNKTIWKHNQEKLGDNYPTTIYINKNMQLIIVLGDKFLYVYGNLDRWREIFRTIDKNIYRKEFEKDTYEHQDLIDDDDDEDDEFDNKSSESSSDSEDSDDSSEESDSDSDIFDEQSVFSSKGTIVSEKSTFSNKSMPETSKLQQYTRNNLPRSGPRVKRPQTPKQLYKLPNEQADEDDDNDDDNYDEDEPKKLKTPEPTKKRASKAAIISSILVLLLALSIGGGVTAFYFIKKKKAATLIENQVEIV